ncbi:MAG: hypothetical protein AAB425_10285, partial [Bdellovibrionota bacterium]
VFFSSYQNNTQRMAPFSRIIPGAQHWLLANRGSARGLPNNTSASYLWRHAPSATPPGAHVPDNEISTGGRDAPVLQAWLKQSRVWRDWTRVEDKKLDNLTRCFDSFIDSTKPKLLVTANQWGLEGWLLERARLRGIPTLQVMHGALGGLLYTQTPVISDALIVFGDFWRNLWPEREQSRILAFNPAPVVARQASRDLLPRLTYFSWPLQRFSYRYSYSEIMDGLIDIFDDLISAAQCEVLIRTHPLENPDDFFSRYRKRRGRIPSALRLSCDEPLADILERTSLAVMFRSTVMIDCLTRRIPIVMPGWLGIGWGGELDSLQGLSLAPDWGEMRTTISSWIDNPPPMLQSQADRFLRPAGEGRVEFDALISRLLSKTAP